MAEPTDTREREADGAEFVRLLTLYQPNIYLYVRSLIPNPDEASEVLQNTNLAMWEKRDQFAIGTNFLAWAFQIARYKLREHRARKKRNVCFSDALVDELAIRASQKIDASAELLEELRRCLAQLAAVDRELIRRRYSSSDACEQIAQAVGRPVRAVYKALARIREELLECVSSRARKEP